MTQMADLAETPLYLAVSLFLAFTAVFFAAVIEAQPACYRLIFSAWRRRRRRHRHARHCSAISTPFPGAEMFTKYDRAAGAFQDPNVFGPFLVLPGIYLLLSADDRQRSRSMPLLRGAAADHHRRHLLLVLARRLGPVRGLGASC